MVSWRLAAFCAALASGGAAAQTSTAVCSSSENMLANELVVAYASQWDASSCSEAGSSCSEACTTVLANLATGLPNCVTASGTNFRAYYASMLDACEPSSSSDDGETVGTSGSAEISGSGSSSSTESGSDISSNSGSGSDVGATVTTPAPTKRSGASAMGFAGMCGFFAVLAFGHIF